MDTKAIENKKHKILLVEDDRVDQMAFKRFVDEEELPYDCTVVEGIADARDILSRRKFDIIILDYFLGDGIAFDLLDSTKDTPVIMVTGSGDEQIAVKAMKAGTRDYLVKDPAGNYLNVIPAAVDNIIEHKKAEAELQEYSRLKNEFITNISHELRTPLTIFKNIISNALAGGMGPVGPNLRENLKVADEAAERLAGIIGSFVDISEIETGDLKLNLTGFDLQPVIAGALNSLSTLTAEKNIELKLNSPVDKLFIDADRERISQVLTELINNAIKFSAQNGYIEISTETIYNEACIRIRDNGPGIESSEIDKIFDHFVQMGKMIGAGGHGTGLGLSIAKELIEMHGGRIEVWSKPGQGTLVTVFLPLSSQYVPEPETTTV